VNQLPFAAFAIVRITKNNIRLCIYKMTAKTRLNIVKINH